MNRCFTGEELAEFHLLHLTREERSQYFLNNGKAKRYRVHSYSFWATLWRRIRPRKIFLIRFADHRGAIIMANSEENACFEAAGSLGEGVHHCEDPYFNKSCDKCREVFDALAERLNHANVTWLGWGQPDYNWVIHV